VSTVEGLPVLQRNTLKMRAKPMVIPRRQQPEQPVGRRIGGLAAKRHLIGHLFRLAFSVVDSHRRRPRADRRRRLRLFAGRDKANVLYRTFSSTLPGNGGTLQVPRQRVRVRCSLKFDIRAWNRRRRPRCETCRGEKHDVQTRISLGGPGPARCFGGGPKNASTAQDRKVNVGYRTHLTCVNAN
jgi:hypothetical protein